MLKLKDIVLQMNGNDSEAFSDKLLETKADKFLTLFTLLRDNKLTDEEITEALQITANAYYTLKSRLNGKVQEFLMSDILGVKADILQRVTNIPQLLYNMPRDTSISLLTKLEQDLLSYDMPWELTRVYTALKKLHINTQKFYEYSQLYNRSVAYALALEKTEELAADFFKDLGTYCISKNKLFLNRLLLLKKEINNHCQLYQSHHLTLYFNIINVSFALFVPLPDEIKDDEPVEDMLDKIEQILSSHKSDSAYKYLYKVYYFLAFEYYHSLKQHKKASSYFKEINEDLPAFMLFNFCSFPAKFLQSKIERSIYLDKQESLYNEVSFLMDNYIADPHDLPGYIYIMKYIAVSAYHSQKYQDSIRTLNDLMNRVNLRNYNHAEVEIKLFLAFCYLIVGNDDMVHNLIKSVNRKIKEFNDEGQYENAIIFSKMLVLLIDPSAKNKDHKVKLLKNKFLLLNRCDTRMLEYIELSKDEFIPKRNGIVSGKIEPIIKKNKIKEEVF